MSTLNMETESMSSKDVGTKEMEAKDIEKKELEERSGVIENEVATKKDTAWVAALVALISLARVSHGLFISITGPTLLFLADNTNSEVSQVSAMFSGRSVGILVGAVCFSAVVNRFKTFQPLLSLGIGLGFNGIVILATPFITSLPGLVIVTTIGGLMFGYLDAGMQAVYLKLWGEEGSRPYIQSFHFGFSVGAFLAPLIATPFLEMANQEGDGGTSCGGEDIYATTPVMNETTTGTPTDRINPISWSFVIIGVYSIIISVLMSVLAICKVENKVSSRNAESTESRKEESIKKLWIFFIPLCCYYFCCVSSEMVYQGYIYAVALCSDLQFDPKQASWLTAVFWAGFGLGRGSGIFISKLIKPSTIIIADLIGTTLIMSIMCVWGEHSTTLTWIVTFIHGLSVATLYSSGVSWSSQVTNMAGTYIFVFAVGGTLGSFAMMPAGGALYEKDPFSVMYLIVGSCVGNILFFVLMNVVARYRQDPTFELEDDDVNSVGKENPAFENGPDNNTKL